MTEELARLDTYIRIYSGGELPARFIEVERIESLCRIAKKMANAKSELPDDHLTDMLNRSGYIDSMGLLTARAKLCYVEFQNGKHDS